MGHEGCVNIPSDIILGYTPFLTFTNMEGSLDVSHYHFYLKSKHNNVETRVNKKWIDISVYSTIFANTSTLMVSSTVNIRKIDAQIEVKHGHNLVNIYFTPISDDYNYAKLTVMMDSRIIDIQICDSERFYFVLKRFSLW